MNLLNKICLIIVFISPAYPMYGQDSSLSPISEWIFNTSNYNPAFSGSKDFFNIGFIGSSKQNSTSQVLYGSNRISKRVPGYLNSPAYSKYTNLGLSGNLFHESYGQSHNIGFKASGAYHLKLNENSLSFFSIGASLKGTYSMFDSTTVEVPDASIELERSFNPNLDLGILYYGPNLYAGISSTNILSNGQDSDTLQSYIPEQRQYHLIAGYKIVLYRPMNIIIEPSVIINTSDSTLSDIVDNINPMLKVYIENFCLGTYLYDWDKTSFFFQYNYQRFYIGTFIAFHRKTAYYKKEPTVEFSAGINLSYSKSKNNKRYHW